MSCRLLLAMVLLLVVPAFASAHGIGVEAKLKGETVVVEVFFDDDTPAADAKLVVTSVTGMMVAEGQADAKGKWSFPAPPGGKYKIAVDAGAGHLAKTSISIPARATQTASTSEQTTPPSMAETTPDFIVTDGLSRSAATGWWRWFMSGVGIAIIGLMTFGLRHFVRKRRYSPDTEQQL